MTADELKTLIDRLANSLQATLLLAARLEADLKQSALTPRTCSLPPRRRRRRSESSVARRVVSDDTSSARPSARAVP